MATRRRTFARRDLLVLAVVLALLVVPGLRESLSSAYIAVSGKVVRHFTDQVVRDAQESADKAQRQAKERAAGQAPAAPTSPR